MSHYFTSDDTEHDFGEIEFVFQGEKFVFKTDRGVFSRNRVDYGTEVLLKAVAEDNHDLENQRMIDMGAGYGPIGIVLSRLIKVYSLMVEVNEDAIDLVKDNMKKNDIQGEVMTRLQYDKSENIKADIYVTNPPFRAGKNVVLSIIDDAYKRLPEGGVFYMVVQKKQGMPSYKKAISQLFGSGEVILKDKGYHVIKGYR